MPEYCVQLVEQFLVTGVTSTLFGVDERVGIVEQAAVFVEERNSDITVVNISSHRLQFFEILHCRAVEGIVLEFQQVIQLLRLFAHGMQFIDIFLAVFDQGNEMLNIVDALFDLVLQVLMQRKFPV